MKYKSFLMTIAIFVFAMNAICQVMGTYTDIRDGKTYKTVKIGTQTWMAENLAFKTDSGCWAYDGKISNVIKYGYFYDWNTAKIACPKGWHIPSNAEWETLRKNCGGFDNAGPKLKSTTGWDIPDSIAATKDGITFVDGNWESPIKPSNKSGFNALPAGSCLGLNLFHNDQKQIFFDLGKHCKWWSSTVTENGGGCFVSLRWTDNNFGKGMTMKTRGYTVRCIKD